MKIHNTDVAYNDLGAWFQRAGAPPNSPPPPQQASSPALTSSEEDANEERKSPMEIAFPDSTWISRLDQVSISCLGPRNLYPEENVAAQRVQDIQDVCVRSCRCCESCEYGANAIGVELV